MIKKQREHLSVMFSTFKMKSVSTLKEKIVFRSWILMVNHK